jgi:hypothetical protein
MDDASQFDALHLMLHIQFLKLMRRQAWHGYRVTIALYVEVGVRTGEPASTTPSMAAAAPPAGSPSMSMRVFVEYMALKNRAGEHGVGVHTIFLKALRTGLSNNW